MAKRSAIAARVLERLRGEDAPLRARGVELMIDALLGMKLGEIVDADAVAATVLEATSGENAARWAERFGQASWARQLARTEAEPEATLADWLGEGEAHTPRGPCREPPAASGRRHEGRDRPALIRELLAPVWQEVLTGFARGLPIPGGGASEPAREGGSAPDRRGLRGRLKARVEKRAESIVERSKTVLGGLGAEVERQVQAAAKEFSQGASDTVKDAVRRRLESDEGKRITAELRGQALAAILDTPAGDALADMRAFPIDDALALAGPVAEHNRTHARWAALVHRKVTATIDVDRDRALREILEGEGTHARHRRPLGVRRLVGARNCRDRRLRRVGK